MAVAAILLVAALAMLVFLLLGIVIELARDVRQLREVSGILDRPLDVDIGRAAGAAPSSYGLPAALDATASAVVLFLSDRCGTCHALAAGFGGRLPPGLWVVLEARSPQSADDFLGEYGLAPGHADGRLIVDAASHIADRLGLRTTPVRFQVEDGRITMATTVPSGRYLASILPTPIALDRPTPVFEQERIASP